MTEENTTHSKTEARVDRVGAFASTACAIHCAVCAFAPFVFAYLHVEWLRTHAAEWALTGFAVSLGLVAIFWGWRRHRHVLTLAFLGIGIIGLLGARGLESGSKAEEAPAVYVASAQTGDSAVVAADPHANCDHEDPKHVWGERMGIFAGIFLLVGHVSNLRQMKRVASAPNTDGEDTCCP